MDKVIFIATKIFFSLCIGAILVTITFYSNTAYLCKNPYMPMNFLTITCVFLAVVLAAMLIYRTRSVRAPISEKIRTYAENAELRIDYAVIIMTVALFIAEICFAYNIYFETGWDVQNTTAAAELIAFGETNGTIEEYYFGMYPNNLFYVFIQAVVRKIGSLFGIFTEYKMMPMIIVNCALTSTACHLVYKVTSLYARKRYAIGAYILAVLSFGLSPWIVIPYTDAFGIIFPIAIFYLFVKPAKSEKAKYINFGFATLLSVFGFLIKPQCLIITIAFIIFEVIRGFRKFHIKNFIKPVALIVSVCIFVPLITAGVTAVAVNNGIEVDSGKKFGPAHYFMMGLNTERQGVWAEEDVEFSKLFISTEARTQANLEKAFSRLENMEDGELKEHITKKILITFNDGTYAWGQEGNFFKEIYVNESNPLSLRLLSYVYMGATNYKTFSSFSHIVWILILCLSFLSVLFKSTTEKSEKEIPVLLLAIFGLILFELLFEVRARYIYTYLPIFCTIAACGLNGTIQKIGLYSDHQKHSKEFEFY